MLSVILEFDVIEGKEHEFITAWTETTQVIYENFGSLGSRLHTSETGTYIAYAQWPDEDTYRKSGEWPEQLLPVREKMRATLKTGKPRVLHQLTLAVDLLKNKAHH